MLQRYFIFFLIFIKYFVSGELKLEPNEVVRPIFCNIFCNGINGRHTLCENNLYQVENCTHFAIKHRKYLSGFVHAHNSLRNRIANLAKLAGMVELHEDVTLVRMAENWLKQCKETEIDQCANFNVENFIENDEQEYLGVIQNVAFLKSKYFPPFLKYYVLRKWYFEKLLMSMPKYDFTTYSNPMVMWTETNLSNNFSHLAYPLASKIGCVMGQYRDGYAIVCNYYKFLLNSRMRYGAGATACPNSFPLRSLKYWNLCTLDNGSSQLNQNFNNLKIFIVVSIIKIFLT